MERELIKWSWREGELAGVNEVVNVHVVDMEVLCSHIVGVRELTGFARSVAYHEGGLAVENKIKQRMFYQILQHARVRFSHRVVRIG